MIAARTAPPPMCRIQWRLDIGTSRRVLEYMTGTLSAVWQTLAATTSCVTAAGGGARLAPRCHFTPPRLWPLPYDVVVSVRMQVGVRFR
jgi:hypothetical protein